ncbi:MAG: phage holin family protein [Candidatus Levyibacteriota bacterium]
MRLVAYLIINSLAVYIASLLIPGVHITNLLTTLIVAIVLGILNSILKPILVFLTLPITVVTLGLFIFVINALMVLLASYLIPGFKVDGFISALLVSIVISLVSWFLNSLLS